MHHRLYETITEVRKRSRRLTLTYATAWVVLVAVLATICFALLDNYLRIEHWSSRFAFSIAWAVVIEWSVRRFLYPWFQHVPSDVAIAQRIQQRYPEFKDQLASAVEFLIQSGTDSRAGSNALRRAVVVDATSKLEQLDTTAVLDSSPTRKAMIASSMAAFVAVVVLILSPAMTRIAITRLAVPWSDAEWPRRHDLEFNDPPQRLAIGSEFEVELVDLNGTLPEKVEIQFRYQEGSSTRIHSEPMRQVGDLMVAHRANVREGFAYRATGGDDHSMAWQKLAVLEPPRVDDLLVTLSPPDYTGWQPTTSTGQVRVLAGTQMAVQATSTKSLKEASLRFEDGTSYPAKIAADGRSFVVTSTEEFPVTIQQSGTYWFDLVDIEDMASGSETRWRIEALPDEPPSVSMELPERDTFVTPDATVPIRVLVKDQLAIRDVNLVYLRGDDSAAGERRVELYSSAARFAELADRGLEQSIIDGHRELVETRWDLRQLDEPLEAGSLITFHVEANDYVPQLGQSQPSLRIHVLSEADLQDRLTDNYTRIVGELSEALKKQRVARQAVADLEIQLNNVGQLPADDMNRLRQTELQQRNIRNGLTQQNDSVLNQIEKLLDEIDNNQIDNPEVAERLGDLKSLLEDLESTHLPEAQQQLTNAIKEGQALAGEQRGDSSKPSDEESPTEALSESAGETDDAQADPASVPPEDQHEQGERPAAAALGQAGVEQDHVVSELSAKLSDLERWSEYRELARDLSRLKRDLTDLQELTAAQGASMLGRDAKELTQQERTHLERLESAQSAMQQEFDILVGQMKQAGKQLEETDPEAAGPLSDAVHHARESGISAELGEAAENIGNNQISRATAQQQKAAEQIGGMLDMLSSRGEDQLERRVKKLRKAEKDLAEMRDRQTGLRKKMEAAKRVAAEQQDAAQTEQQKQELKRLAREQRELQEEMQRMMRRLKRLHAERAGAKMSQAGSSAGKASEAGEQGDAAEADKQAAQAERDLEEAQQELAEARKQAERDLARQILARIEDELKALHERQASLLEQTRRLDAIRVTVGKLTRGQRGSVSNLANEQQTLSETTGAITADLAAAETFGLVFKRAAEAMERAAGRLADFDTGEGKTGEGAQRHQRAALRRLQLPLDALKEPENNEEDQPGGGNQPGGEGQGGGQQDAQDGIRTIAEIRLLKLLQTDLNARTDELYELIGDGVPSEELAEELRSLTEEQGEMADILFRKMDEAAAAPEDELNEPADEDTDIPAEEPLSL